MTSGHARSVHTRLIRHAKEVGLDPNLVLTRYANERFLYRLSRSPHSERFVLKGAMLLIVWLGETIRPTRDIDLLGYGNLSDDQLTRLFAEVCTLAVESDAVEYNPASIRVAAIRPEDAYGGQRVTLTAHLGSARLKVQIDVGIGDDVHPAPEWIEYPTLLDQPAPQLLAYRPETVIAEKLHAMVTLGSVNSRMRDFFDIQVLSETHSFTGQTLATAIASTFARRHTPIPDEPPLALTPAFAAVEGKASQWGGFLRRIASQDAPRNLAEAIVSLARFLLPVLTSISRDEPFTADWPARGPWTNS